jgi:hypothetical protein
VTDIETHQSTLFPQAIRSTSVAHNHSSDDRQHHNDEPPFLALLAKTSHCSKFKKNLEESFQMESDSLASLELFVDGIKSDLDMALCSHYSFSPYNEWALGYLVTTTICPPALRGHPRYTMMCINYNVFGLVLHRFLWSGNPVTFIRSPIAYHELTAL